MADDQRLTKAERREQARAERRRKEAEEAARAKRRRITSLIVGTLITAFVVWILWLAFSGGPKELDGPQVIDPAAVDAARGANGCVPMPTDLTGNAQHFAPAEAPPASSMYTLRPTANGPHFERPIAAGTYRGGMDERGSTHSMEHGAVIAWWNPDLVDGATQDQIVAWAEVLNANGFAKATSGAGIFAAEYDQAFTSGKAVALRAWGVALDCDTWDETVANGFVVDHFGSHGLSPERTLGPYPETVLLFGPGADETESPNGAPDVVVPSANEGDGSGMETDGSTTDGATTDGSTTADDTTADDTTADDTGDDAEASPEPSPSSS